MMTSILVVAGLVALKVLWSSLTAGTARPSTRPVYQGYVLTEFARAKRANRSEYVANEYLGGRK